MYDHLITISLKAVHPFKLVDYNICLQSFAFSDLLYKGKVHNMWTLWIAYMPIFLAIHHLIDIPDFPLKNLSDVSINFFVHVCCRGYVFSIFLSMYCIGALLNNKVIVYVPFFSTGKSLYLCSLMMMMKWLLLLFDFLRRSFSL